MQKLCTATSGHQKVNVVIDLRWMGWKESHQESAGAKATCWGFPTAHLDLSGVVRALQGVVQQLCGGVGHAVRTQVRHELHKGTAQSLPEAWLAAAEWEACGMCSSVSL